MRQQLKPLLLLALWAGITAALHLALGSAPHTMGFVGTLHRNLEPFRLSESVLISLFLAPLWILTAIGYRRSKGRYKALAVIAAVYAMAVVGGSLWDESARLMLPAMVLCLPSILT